MSNAALRLSRHIAIALAILPIALFLFRSAHAAEFNGGHHNGFSRVAGTVGPANPSDGRWYFISGQKQTVTIVAQSSNGVALGSLAVYSQRQGWLQTGSAASTQHQYRADLIGGWHYIRVSANGSNTASYTLTIASADLTADAGSTVASARNLGVVGDVNQSGRVSAIDQADVYSFQTSNPAPGYGQKFISVYAFKAWSNGATVDLARIVNGVETPIASGLTAFDSQSPIFAKPVPAGAYILRVRMASGQEGTGYQLYASIEDARADLGGNPGAMVPIPSRPVAEFLHDRMDPTDMYTWTMSQGATVNINVRENAGDANLTLINAQGVVVGRSQVLNSSSEIINQFLPAGDYRLIIGTVRAGETGYVLTFAIVTPPAPITPLDASNTRQTASFLLPGNQFAYNRSETIGGIIGVAFDTQDWYTLAVPPSAIVRPNDLRAFSVTVSGLPLGTTVTIIHERNNQVADSRIINNIGSVTYGVSLAGGGNNLVQISVPFGTPLTPYSLSLACVGGAPCDR